MMHLSSILIMFMMGNKMSNYEKLAAIDVSKHIEKKNNLSYLSWAWAVDQLLRADSTANWAYNPTVTLPDGTMLVSCTVTAFDKPMTMHLPVMDYRNKAISNPDAFSVNTAMMRCLVKAIALHGLGLYIYAGEDLPESTPAKSVPKDVFDGMDSQVKIELQGIAEAVIACLDADKMEDAINTMKEVGDDTDRKVALWSLFDSKQRAAMKRYQQGA
jgi:hypothetical protein